MARKRVHARRKLALLAALCLLIFLLQLNNWLPGTWPGGGGGGFLTAEQPEPQPPEIRVGGEGTHAARVTGTAEPPPAETRRDALTVEVRSPMGRRLLDWRLGIGGSGPMQVTPDETGLATVRNPRVREAGFRVRADKRTVQHVIGANEGRHWVVHLPVATPTRPRKRPVTVRARGSGDAPLAHARLEMRSLTPSALGEARTVTTDASGVAEVRPGDRPVHVSLPNRERASGTWLTAYGARDVVLAADTGAGPAGIHVEAGPLIADGAAIEEIVVRDGSGEVLVRCDSLAALANAGVAADRAAGGRVEVRLRKGAGSYAVAQALEDGQARFGPHATQVHRVEVLGPDGEPLEGARVVASYEASGRGGGEMPRLEAAGQTDALGTVALEIPNGEATLEVEGAPGTVPVRTQLTAPGDGTQRVTLAAASKLVIALQDDDGAPVADGRVVVRSALGNGTLEQDGRTDGTGRFVAASAPPGPFVVYAAAADRAWQTLDGTHTEGETTTTLTLPPGGSISVVVADPNAVPIAGARITVQAAGDGTPVVLDPSVSVHETDARGRLVIEHLPRRPLKLRVMAPGYGSATLAEVTPGDGSHFVTLVADE